MGTMPATVSDEKQQLRDALVAEIRDMEAQGAEALLGERYWASKKNAWAVREAGRIVLGKEYRPPMRAFKALCALCHSQHAGVDEFASWSAHESRHRNHGRACADCQAARAQASAQKLAAVRSRERLTAELRALPYDEYLQTEHWQKQRKAALKRAGYRCQLCNDAEKLEVHHRTYERLGEEWDMDLTVLCKGCHERHHGIRKEGADGEDFDFEDDLAPSPGQEAAVCGITATEEQVMLRLGALLCHRLCASRRWPDGTAVRWCRELAAAVDVGDVNIDQLECLIADEKSGPSIEDVGNPTGWLRRMIVPKHEMEELLVAFLAIPEPRKRLLILTAALHMADCRPVDINFRLDPPKRDPKLGSELQV